MPVFQMDKVVSTTGGPIGDARTQCKAVWDLRLHGFPADRPVPRFPTSTAEWEAAPWVLQFVSLDGGADWLDAMAGRAPLSGNVGRAKAVRSRVASATKTKYLRPQISTVLNAGDLPTFPDTNKLIILKGANFGPVGPLELSLIHI